MSPEETREAVGVEAEAIEAVASERWMQERVSVRTEQGADLLPWHLLTEETREQKIHQARQLLQAALPYLQKQFRDQLLSDEARDAAVDALADFPADMEAKAGAWLGDRNEDEWYEWADRIIDAALKATPTATEEAG